MAEEGALGPAVAKALRWGVTASGVLLAAGLAAGPDRGAGVVKAGIAVLVATPIVRVLLLTAGHGRRREWPFMWAGLFVLSLLALSVFLGRVHG